MLRWLQRLWGKRTPESQSRPQRRRFEPRILSIPRFDGSGDPPPLHWKACHPSTARRFKAEMTCRAGHGLVLKGHSVDAGGMVRPSVVCMTRGCGFHEFVRLSNWTLGQLD
jgi:hypothetical protein